MDQHFLTPLFSPRSIIVFAGNPEDLDSQAPMARALLTELTHNGFSGQISFLDIEMTGTLSDLAHTRADLAVIALPHEQIEAALEIAGRIRCRAALVLSANLPGPACANLHAVAKRHGVHLLGPNSLGFQRPLLKLNASAAGPMAAPGPLALVSQSGALTSSILDWARRNGVGFSTVVSLGANTAVDLAQVLDFLATDGATHSILVYMEGITHARRFMSALRAAASVKPVVVMKAGRMPAGTTAALTHSAAIVGADDVFEAALRRAGVVRVRAFTQLFSAARCLASRYRPVGKRLAIVTNGGGPGVLAADWTNDIGLEVARLDPQNRNALAPLLSPSASLNQVLDLGEDATEAHYKAAVEACGKDSGVDGVLAIYAPKPACYPGADPVVIAQAVIDGSARLGKPVVACWMGDDSVRPARELLNAKPLPSFRTPEAAVDAFGNIASFYQNQQLLTQTPPPLSTLATPDTEGARLLIEGVLAERRRVLTEMESKALLAAFHIPVTRTMLARTANEAMLIASQLGYPVALKIDSPDISHKSDVQGVALGVMTATQVRDTFNDMLARVAKAKPGARINGVTIQPMSGKPRGRELYIGLTTDDPFGPVITFGAGGTMIELINDQAMELPPLNQFLARRLIERARVAETLGHWRGAPPVNIESLEQVLLRLSEMVCALPQLQEMDINPIIVDEDGAVAVDARVVIEHAGPQNQAFHHLAILPYPAGLEREWPMKGGGLYTIRPIQPDDAEMLQALVKSLSPESRYFRFVSSMQELPAKMLARYTLIDYDREMALVAVHTDRVLQDDGSFVETEQIIGVSRYITNPDQTSCEFSLVVSDGYAGQGLGSRLMLSIMDVARTKGLAEIEGLVLANNDGMLRLMRSLGFQIKPFAEDADFKLCTKTL
ncbi:bifunctional acetate--CoA ligase family protein/GNAT family N-acetyltransferase [Ideonella sp. 4Y11]|uniref:Bifunctional acetate--CoA ligase family protein/GNAT family N-acetyltransferase n=1 Tax=Ideonella aquatica TaxID=2824119 RepID=A0A941BP08_9BURK|nr:bifunctional acetate--CoA ligase family protein/GNAT family N-acetyltransferase [Ideonella aquatica]MBQ0957555.1 bifunctional acetate--CoA ligase family protein/GNAT family N-acetyltransferase [Ideonella aquatica]